MDTGKTTRCRDGQTPAECNWIQLKVRPRIKASCSSIYTFFSKLHFCCSLVWETPVSPVTPVNSKVDGRTDGLMDGPHPLVLWCSWAAETHSLNDGMCRSATLCGISGSGWCIDHCSELHAHLTVPTTDQSLLCVQLSVISSACNCDAGSSAVLHSTLHRVDPHKRQIPAQLPISSSCSASVARVCWLCVFAKEVKAWKPTRFKPHTPTQSITDTYKSKIEIVIYSTMTVVFLVFFYFCRTKWMKFWYDVFIGSSTKRTSARRGQRSAARSWPWCSTVLNRWRWCFHQKWPPGWSECCRGSWRCSRAGVSPWSLM